MQPRHSKNIVSRTPASGSDSAMQGALYASIVLMCGVFATLLYILYQAIVIAPSASVPDSETMTLDSAAYSLCRAGGVTVVGVNRVKPEWSGMTSNVLYYNVLLRADSCNGVQRSFKIRQNDAMYNVLEAIVRRDTTGGVDVNAFRIRIK